MDRKFERVANKEEIEAFLTERFTKKREAVLLEISNLKNIIPDTLPGCKRNRRVEKLTRLLRCNTYIYPVEWRVQSAMSLEPYGKLDYSS